MGRVCYCNGGIVLGILAIYGIGVWLFLAFLAAFVAKERGRSGVGFFFLALLTSFLVASLALIALPVRESSLSIK